LPGHGRRAIVALQRNNPAAMTENDPARALTEADVEAIVDVFVKRISEPRTVEQITSAWSGAIDRAIGRGVRRVAYAVLFSVLMVGAVKFDLVTKFLKG
jgi:hypothetical protein